MGARRALTVAVVDAPTDRAVERSAAILVSNGGCCRAGFGNVAHPFSARARAGFHQGDELIEAMAAIVPAATARAQGEVAEWFSAVCLREPLEGLREMTAQKLLGAIRWRDVPDDLRSHWLEWAITRKNDDSAATVVLAELAETMDMATEALLARAEEGNLMALIRGWPVRREVPRDVAAPFIARLAQHLDKRIAEMEAHTYVWEGSDRAAQLAWLNVHCPEAADWDILVRFLVNPAVAVDDKSGTCHYLASPDVQVPEATRRALADAGEALAIGSDGFFGGDDGSLRSAALVLRHKVGALEGDNVGNQIATFASSSAASDRLVAARTVRDLPDPSVSPHLLLALLGDEDARVSIAAASGVARRSSRDPDDPVLQQALLTTLGARGAALAHTALGWIDADSQLPKSMIEAFRQSTTHPSAAVRARAKHLLARLGHTTQEAAINV